MTQKDFYPQSIAHLKKPYLNDIDEKVIIAEISSEPVNDYRGYRQVHTALIPFTDLDEVLNASGGIGYEVESWGPLPCVDDDQVYDGSFYVCGVEGSNKRYETIINTWNYHNKTVLLPDNSLLMSYGLTPRYLQDGVTHWDKPDLPEYGVLEVRSLSNYQSFSSPASIVIKKKYLEDYCIPSKFGG